MGSLDGKVAVVTGAARGQGRSHALTLAREGADVIAIDICAQPAAVTIPGATREDLEETERQVRDLGGRIVTAVADVRDPVALGHAVDTGVSEFGRLDIVVANAGVWAVNPSQEPMGPEERAAIWSATVDINLTGVFNTLIATVPAIVDGKRGGAIVITGSTAGAKGLGSIGPFGSRLHAGQASYAASKHGLRGLLLTSALELAPHEIRVNMVMPTGVATPMVENSIVGTVSQEYPHLGTLLANAMPVDLVQPEDISNAVLYLVTDASRYVTGTTLPVDAGFLVR